MQRDVQDAAHWLIKSGYASKGDLCALGPSYGGYSAVMAALVDYDVFSCAVSINGVMSMPDFVASVKKQRFKDISLPH